MKLCAFLLLTLVTVPGFAQKRLLFQDAVYEENIKTVMLHPPGGNRDNLLPSVAPLGQQNLILEFDDIQESRNNYYLRIIHCNSDWTKSSLLDLDFMPVYNEFVINDYQYSNNTYLPFVHYKIQVPRVKLPGNYLVMVYRESNKDDIVLTARMMIFDNRVTLSANTNLVGNSTLNATNQQINFFVDYKGLQVFNAMDNFKVVIRQNQRWDNARFNVKPSFIRDDISQLEYRFFDQDKQWLAGNEFRFVDFRSLISPGRNTLKIDRTVKPFVLKVQPDGSREGLAYAQYADLDGNYAIENLDYHDPVLSCQYIFVDFTLRVPEVPGATIYVMGNFNHFAKTDENRMKWNRATGAYETSIVLKQGWYDYTYYVESPTLPATHFEGSHYQTENFYEVFVYYKSLTPMADLLVGYYGMPYR
ncbi:MAG TPA: DUF5103 domain-containing protein [Cyclobacteriaceae bacterium]|nr:DUF5103 domain-containing protein [Cyclobacteriaceae bacterium]